jgi:TATA-box binding protein (TBP) (component of TFIID and TFIIIB)
MASVELSKTKPAVKAENARTKGGGGKPQYAKTKSGKRVELNPKFKIENIVASADLGVELDLYGIAKASPDVDYEPEQFPGAICKIHDPKTALLLFKNGKIICTGAKTEADIKRAIDQVIKIIKNYILEPS